MGTCRLKPRQEGTTMSSWSRVRSAVFSSLSFSIGLIVATAATPTHAEETATSLGEALYRERCATCHDGGVARAPDRNALRQLAPERIGFALAYGIMNQQGRDLSRGQIGDIVRFLAGGPAAAPAVLPDSSCREPAPSEMSLPHWNGWGVDIRQHRFQPADQAQLAPDDVPRLKLKWSFGFPGDVRADAQPTVFGGRVFV